MFLRNSGVYLRVYTTPKPSTTTSPSSAPRQLVLHTVSSYMRRLDFSDATAIQTGRNAKWIFYFYVILKTVLLVWVNCAYIILRLTLKQTGQNNIKSDSSHNDTYCAWHKFSQRSDWSYSIKMCCELENMTLPEMYTHDINIENGFFFGLPHVGLSVLMSTICISGLSIC
jgi:hypothetical protein